MKKLTAMLLMLVMLFANTATILAANENVTVNTYEIDGVTYTVTITYDDNGIPIESIVESEERTVIAHPSEDGIDMTIEDNITSEVEAYSYIWEFAQELEESSDNSVVLPSPFALLDNYTSMYFSGDRYYLYDDDEYHLYYSNAMINTKAKPSTQIVSYCKDFVYSLKSYDNATTGAAGCFVGGIPVIGDLVALAEIADKIQSGQFVGIDIILAAVSHIPGLGRLVDAASLISYLVLMGALHHNYKTDYNQVKKLI